MGNQPSITRPGVVRLLEKEPTAAERYGHAAALLAILGRAERAAVALPPSSELALE